MRTIIASRLALTVAILAGSGAALAVEPASEPWIAMHKVLRGMQNSVKNVSVVLDQGANSIRPSPGKTWFESCCSANVAHIRSGTAELRKSLDHLEAQYAKLRDLDAIAEIQTVRQHLVEVETIFVNLGNSVNLQDARARLSAIIHPFNHVRKTVQALEACCPVEPPATAAESGP